MEFENRVSQSSEPEEVIAALSDGPAGEFDMGVLFLSMMSRDAVEQVIDGIRENIAISHLLVGTCSGIVGGHIEVENKPAAALLLAKLPGVRVSPFYLNQSNLMQLKETADWHKFFNIFPNEAPVFLMMPDPFLFDIQSFLNGINAAYPNCATAGGLASGANQAQGNTLFLDDTVYDQGMVGLALTGDIRMDTVVSQGCRPIGEVYVVTHAKENIIYELSGRSFFEALEEVVKNASAQDQVLIQQAILLGVTIDEGKEGYRRGDFLIRGLMRLDRESGSGVIGDAIQAGQSIQFHVRDAEAAIEDLNALLILQQKRMKGCKPKGALVFTCNGRGENLFSCKHHDIETIQDHLGPVPAAGFFCAGEIGSIGSKAFLHGFTNSMALFYSRSEG
ncbi:FIST C-terminal domain-containing protein [Nitrospira defluvii]|nr:FIST C-terminal domain-containing protein [Nitrospira defluvii]